MHHSSLAIGGVIGLGLVLTGARGASVRANPPPASLRGGGTAGRISNLYVGGLPIGALLMVRRLRQRAERKNKRLEECKGHSTWGLFYSAFRDDTWW